MAASGMIVRHDHQNEYWPEDIFWPVVNRFTQKGWRTGKTRVYTLQCGHRYGVPASKAEGAGKTAKCTFCTSLWHYITTGDGGGIDPLHDIKDMHGDMLAAMHGEARRRGKLSRPVERGQA